MCHGYVYQAKVDDAEALAQIVEPLVKKRLIFRLAYHSAEIFIVRASEDVD